MALRSSPYPTLALTVPITNPNGQIVIGPYNNTDTDPPSHTVRTSGVLVIGAGKATTTGGITTVTRRNAMRITDDGVVLIQESGDIPMGDFTAGPRP